MPLMLLFQPISPLSILCELNHTYYDGEDTKLCSDVVTQEWDRHIYGLFSKLMSLFG